MKWLIFLLLLVPFSAMGCDPSDKVYPQSYGESYAVATVYVCSNSGEPSYKERPWICRTDLSEGVDRDAIYYPLCPGAKSEYERLKERKEMGHQ